METSSGTSNQGQKCSSGSVAVYIIQNHSLWSNQIPIQMSRQQSRESFFVAHCSPPFSTVYILTWSGGKSSARGLSKWDVSVLRATCLWFKLQFSWSFILDKIWRNYLFLPALRTQCDKRLKYWLMQLIRLIGGKIKCLKHCYQIVQLIFLKFIKETKYVKVYPKLHPIYELNL